VRELLQVDPEWSVEIDRGVEWWAHRLRQRLWSSAPKDTDGEIMCRVQAVTDVVRRVILPRDRLAQALSALNSMADSSALVTNLMPFGSAPVDDGDGVVVRAHTAVWVHEQIAPWIGDMLATFALIQLRGRLRSSRSGEHEAERALSRLAATRWAIRSSPGMATSSSSSNSAPNTARRQGVWCVSMTPIPFLWSGEWGACGEERPQHSQICPLRQKIPRVPGNRGNWGTNFRIKGLAVPLRFPG
jgi:hypothetical protein